MLRLLLLALFVWFSCTPVHGATTLQSPACDARALSAQNEDAIALALAERYDKAGELFESIVAGWSGCLAREKDKTKALLYRLNLAIDQSNLGMTEHFKGHDLAAGAKMRIALNELRALLADQLLPEEMVPDVRGQIDRIIQSANHYNINFDSAIHTPRPRKHTLIVLGA